MGRRHGAVSRGRDRRRVEFPPIAGVTRDDGRRRRRVRPSGGLRRQPGRLWYSASGGLTIALDALGSTYLMRAQETGLDPALLHRVAVIGAGTLDSLPHNGAVVTLLSVCGSTHGESYRDIVVVGIIGAILALIAVIVLGTILGSF
jgi:hypothetical protein